jgi:Putative quorum-sensing-regulated virulence factor
MNDITIDFGQFKGKKLSEVPRHYLDWMADEMVVRGKRTDYPSIARQFRDAIRSRREPHRLAQETLPATYRRCSVCGRRVDDLRYFIFKEVNNLTFCHVGCLEEWSPP